jgi:peptidoglycan/xylan/chitin deacetylase (PgdA/CDA1 family)
MPGYRLSGVLPRSALVVSLMGLLMAGIAIRSNPAVAEESAEQVGGFAWVPATVLGTDGINVRSCASLSCAVLGTVKLGESIWVTGPEEDGFSPVDYAGLQGYAYDLYLMKDGESAPYLLEGEAGCKRIAIIFNVGIGDHPILGILDDLKDRDVPATVFLMGWWAEAHPKEARRIADLGFVIGSHGNQRTELTGLSDAQIGQDIAEANAAITAAIGEQPSPWFTAYSAASDDRTRGIVARTGYLPVEWKVPAADFGPGATAKSVYSRVMPSVYDGAIVEFHLDGPASATSTAVALPWIVEELRDDGYSFVTIPEMANPCEADS